MGVARVTASGSGAGGITEVSSDGSPTLGGDLEVAGFDLLDVGQIVANTLDLGTQAAAVPVNVAASPAQYVVLSGDATITASGDTAGKFASTLLKITQDGTGGRTPTWSGVDAWVGGEEPTVDETAGANTYVTLLGFGATVIGIAPSGGQRSIEVNDQAGAYTLVLADAGKAVDVTSASGVALTIPPNASVAFEVGTVIEVAQLGAGLVTLTQGAGVTLAWLDGDGTTGTGNKAMAGQYGVVSLRKTATNTWLASGALAV